MYMTVKYAGSGKKITIYDLAEIAGVSHTCVSRALLDRDDIGEDTKKQIRKLAEKFNYQPNEIARNLVLKRTYNVGVAIATFTDPTNTEFLQCFFEELKKNTYSMMPFITDYNFPERELNLLMRKKIDGLILFPGDSGHERYTRFHSVPLVFCGNLLPMKNSVTVDRAKGTYDAVKYLIGMGHRDFAYLCYPNIDINMNVSSKLTGFRKAIIERGIVFKRDMLIKGLGTLEDGYVKTQELLSRGKMPTAILYNNDLSAMGGLDALAKKGIRVPDDVSVVGFDNIEMSQFTIPALTTIAKPIKKLAENVVRMLMKRMENPDIEHEQITLEQNLVVRESTGPARR